MPVEAGVVSYDRDGVLDAKTESYPTLTFNIHDLDADFSFMPAVPTSVEMTNQMLVDTNAYLVFSIVSAFVLLGLISALVFKREI